MNIIELLQTIATDFEECGIVYCVVGGQALSLHNYIRATNDIDLLVSRDTFDRIEECLVGRGYIFRPGNRKGLYAILKDARYPIDVIVEGETKGTYILPNPKGIRVRYARIWWVNLAKLIELKLHAGRRQDLVDVYNLIIENELPVEFARFLDYGKGQYRRIWASRSN